LNSIELGTAGGGELKIEDFWMSLRSVKIEKNS